MGTSTTAVHGGGAEEVPTGALGTPVYRTSTFRFATTDDLLEGARGRRPGFYTRYGHPNFRVVEEKHASLHGAEDAALFGSGMAALHAAFQTLVATGERIVAFRDVYGGTLDLLRWLERRSGITTTWLATGDLAALEAALPGARLFVAESPTNPLLRVLDLPAIAAVCRRHRVPFLLDGTFAGPA